MNWLWENRKREIRHESKCLWPSSRKDGTPWAETGKFTMCSPLRDTAVHRRQ